MKDFITKNELMSRGKIGKREYLNSSETKDFMIGLDKRFNSYVEIPRIMQGKRQKLETLISVRTRYNTLPRKMTCK
jgi:hypothetical protein